MSRKESAQFERLPSDAGIAIGPILFIIAILAILAAAIAAGSGSFTAPTASEGDKTKSSALIQVGDNLKMGMDRLTMENSVTFGNWTINATNTSNSVDLFSPAGGGISAPASSLAGNPGSDHWEYPVGPIAQMGTGADDQLAVLNVTDGVCNEINNRANGFNTLPTGVDLGDFSASSPGGSNDPSLSAWPTELKGKTVGCIVNSHDSKNYFFEVLFIQ